MVEDDIKRPFQAYEGDEKYIFVSYAHKDRNLVFPEIKRFHDKGFPIWYDDGLTPGQEWDDEIAEALLDCSLLIVFISKNSVKSTNVQDEIRLALEEEIDVTPIYLEDTKLPPALRLRLSGKHAIFKYSLSDEDYIRDCFKAFNNSEIPKISYNAKDHNYLSALIHHSDNVSLKEDILLEKTMVINKDNITIDGNGHSIDGNGRNRIFRITGKNVILKNLIFKNAKAPDNLFDRSTGYGGAIINNSQLELVDCEFINNFAQNDGIDILNIGNLKIENCKFSNNAEGKYAVVNRGLIKAYENEKCHLEEYISDNNIEWLSKNDSDEETAVESMASEPATDFKPSGDKNHEYISKRPFEAYEGDEPYVFVSFRHDDYKKVYPVISKLHNAGINIWYDAGLTVGSDYDIQIAKHIVESSLFVTFITDGAIRCSNDQYDYPVKELAVAVHMRKKCLPIFIDDVRLDGFYLMHYRGSQSILKYEYGDNEDLFIDTCISLFKQFGIEPTKQ